MYRLNDNDLGSLKWISFVRDTLHRKGFGHIWNEQSHITISKFKTEFQQSTFKPVSARVEGNA